MTSASRWLGPAVAIALGFAALSPQAHAQDSLTRVLVNVADVVMRGGDPYYRYGNNGIGDRLIVQRDRYGRPVYYRTSNGNGNGNGNGGHHDVDHGAYGNGYSGTNGYGSSGYYGGNGYGGNGYGGNGYGGNGYGGSGYGGNGYYGASGYDGNGYNGQPAYGNAYYGTHQNAAGRHGRGNSQRRSRQHERHDRHDRRDCQRYGESCH